jgi:hypothetical protein
MGRHRFNGEPGAAAPSAYSHRDTVTNGIEAAGSRNRVFTRIEFAQYDVEIREGCAQVGMSALIHLVGWK